MKYLSFFFFGTFFYFNFKCFSLINLICVCLPYYPVFYAYASIKNFFAQLFCLNIKYVHCLWYNCSNQQTKQVERSIHENLSTQKIEFWVFPFKLHYRGKLEKQISFHSVLQKYQFNNNINIHYSVWFLGQFCGLYVGVKFQIRRQLLRKVIGNFTCCSSTVECTVEAIYCCPLHLIGEARHLHFDFQGHPTVLQEQNILICQRMDQSINERKLKMKNYIQNSTLASLNILICHIWSKVK